MKIKELKKLIQEIPDFFDLVIYNEDTKVAEEIVNTFAQDASPESGDEDVFIISVKNQLNNNNI